MSTDYSKMSDFEINLAVAHIAIGSGGYDWSSDKKEVYLAAMDGGEFLPNAYFNTCNNPADAWPIIIDNKISIVSLDNKWIAAPVDTVIDGITGDSEVCFYASSDAVFDVNPFRAAMIVFLMMQGSKNAS
nr:MAG TPA: Protein of unknown function (DUF2591) [Caudoviricetes sp.]